MSARKTREPRYAVGIDLGTTNSAVAEVELSGRPASEGGLPAPRQLEIPQVIAPGETAARALLPSFVYLPSPHEAPAGAFALPWAAERDHVVGAYARDRGALVPGRLVSSAKSWLSHPAVDRRAALLPLQAEAEVPRISPVEASARVLRHLREAWEAAHAADGAPRLADQAVTLTVPASFDPVARELTVQAAQEAGLPESTLLEEPQAALYAWVQAEGDAWRKQVAKGDVILVVDVGGGTTDFSLIGVGEEDGKLALTRLAVGDHILLGGDNVDLALAHLVQERLRAQGKKLDAWQFAALGYACQKAKENPALDAEGKVPLAIPGRGSGLVAGTVRTELSRDELRATVEAFFPRVAVGDAPRSQRRTGLTALGLPYAQDAAVTRHLAAFLRRNAAAAREAGLQLPPGATFLHPSAILFNGGVFKDAALQERVEGQVDAWVSAEGGRKVTRLRSRSLDLAVALGAAYSGLARRGRGIRIRGGTARTYYVGVEAAAPAVPGYAPRLHAVCLAPFGMEEGTSVDLPELEVGAVVGETTAFRFFASDQRRGDAPGAVVDDVEELSELAPIEAALPAEAGDGAAGEVIPVGLRTAVTEVGTLTLRLVARAPPPREWKLEFSVRGDPPPAEP
ncbi:MAG: Hsp70 family protein [Myxococcales bacterium]